MSRNNTVGKVATKIITVEGVTAIWYHETIVVSFDSKKIALNNGGWKTPTTKVRMNQASQQFDLGFGVYQKDSEWFCTYKGETIPFVHGKVTLTR